MMENVLLDKDTSIVADPAKSFKRNVIELYYATSYTMNAVSLVMLTIK